MARTKKRIYKVKYGPLGSNINRTTYKRCSYIFKTYSDEQALMLAQMQSGLQFSIPYGIESIVEVTERPVSI